MAANRSRLKRPLLQVKPLSHHISSFQGQLSQFPESDDKPTTQDLLVIPDLFANALKLIHILVKKNILKLEHGAEDYQKLVNIYNQFPYAPNEKIDFKALICEFDDILLSATVFPIDQIVLLGKDLFSEGNCDFLMMLVVKRLSFDGQKRAKLNFLNIIHSDLNLTLIEKIIRNGIDEKSYDRQNLPNSSSSLLKLLAHKVVLADRLKSYYED